MLTSEDRNYAAVYAATHALTVKEIAEIYERMLAALAEAQAREERE